MADTTWTFETTEQVDDFLEFVLKLKTPKLRGKHIAVKSSRNPLVVFMNSECLRQMAKAYQFGWMACQEAHFVNNNRR